MVHLRLIRSSEQAWERSKLRAGRCYCGADDLGWVAAESMAAARLLSRRPPNHVLDQELLCLISDRSQSPPFCGSRSSPGRR